MVALWASALAAVSPLLAQEAPSPLPEHLILLSRAKQHMRTVLVRQPNYTCQMSIERSRRRNPRRGFELVDQLRLEVALIDGKESFSWPGARKFDDRELRDMVGGTSSTGSFALHARAVFFGNVPRFTYLGPRPSDTGRLTHHWRFDVPQHLSGYMLRVADRTGGTQQAVVGYHGEFAIDAATLDLVSLSYAAEEIPPHLEIQSTSDTITYERIAIGPERFLLPTSSDLVITDTEGTANRNRTRFHNCRQYAGESTLIFDEPPAEGAPPPAAPVPIPTLPAGLALEGGLDEKVTHPIVVGSPIRITLTKAARMKGQTYLPKGAVIHGRLLRSGTLAARSPLTYYTLVFEQIESAGVFADAAIRLDDVLPPQMGTTRQMLLDFEPGERTPTPGHFTIAITGNRPELREGLRLMLSIAAPAAPPEPPALNSPPARKRLR
ncbi:MAG: hypothetical protein J0L64_09915 [Acidobacteria bacterium]|nr:hypothetical protein [Acidobacteriota bacterium]